MPLEELKGAVLYVAAPAIDEQRVYRRELADSVVIHGISDQDYDYYRTKLEIGRITNIHMLTEWVGIIEVERDGKKQYLLIVTREAAPKRKCTVTIFSYKQGKEVRLPPLRKLLNLDDNERIIVWRGKVGERKPDWKGLKLCRSLAWRGFVGKGRVGIYAIGYGRYKIKVKREWWFGTINRTYGNEITVFNVTLTPNETKIEELEHQKQVEKW